MALSADPGATPTRETVDSLEAAVHELRHRLRNAYAVASAIAAASGREAPEHREFALALAQRFTTLSLVQSRLLDEPGSERLPRLVEQLTGAFATSARGVRLDDLPDVPLDEQVARLLGLVIGELCANSVRHGVFAGAAGQVVLGGDVADGKLTLQWREPMAGGVEDRCEIAGRGLLSRMARAHGGTLAWEDDAGTLVARLELPLPG